MRKSGLGEVADVMRAAAQGAIVERQGAPQEADQNKESGGQPLQVDRRGGEIILDLQPRGTVA